MIDDRFRFYVTLHEVGYPLSSDFISFTLNVLVTEVEVERLQQALKILTDAEKQLRHSSERSMWFIATLLQLGSCQKLVPNGSNSSISCRGHIDNVSAVSENR